MSENESFINEVTEEVRRDRLYLFAKKYGWVIGLVLLSIVGASISFELLANMRKAEHEERGTYLNDLITDIKEGKIQNFDSLDIIEDGSLVSLLVQAKFYDVNGDAEKAKDVYKTILNQQEFPSSFRNLAKFKLALLIKDDSILLKQILAELIEPNNPFRNLALEQRVLLAMRENNWIDAETNINLLKGDPTLSQGFLARVDQIQNAISFSGFSD